jgi:hypothetical protein
MKLMNNSFRIANMLKALRISLDKIKRAKMYQVMRLNTGKFDGIPRDIRMQMFEHSYHIMDPSALKNSSEPFSLSIDRIIRPWGFEMENIYISNQDMWLDAAH